MYPYHVPGNSVISLLQDEEKMQLRERQKEQEHLENNDAVVAQQMKVYQRFVEYNQ